MASTQTSRRDVFRRIAQRRPFEWPAYDSTPFYDCQSLGGLEQDVRTLAGVWFEHDAHTSVDEFVCQLPLAYVGFAPHDRYTGATRYGMAQLLRVFLVKELHGWDYETALIEYLKRRPSLRRNLGFETVPDQSTLWRSWHHRFTADLRETVDKAARLILIRIHRSS
ncbi:transposase [Haloplanus rubicundus]